MEKKYKENIKRIPIKRVAIYSSEIKEALGRLQKKISMQELEEYSSEISAVIDDYNRKSTEETMMVKGIRKSNQETTNRKTHQQNLANVAVRIAKGINKKQYAKKEVGINCEIVEIMARNHDIGHTFSGHSGEWWLSNVKEDYGIGYYCHNALGPRELIYTNKVYDEIIDIIKQSHPDILDEKLQRIKKSLWLIMEGINSHNGEKSESEYIADFSKTEADFKRENLYCHTKKGFDKTVMPATPEAALMRLCDKISYIPYDMLDGLKEGFITELNEEYKVVLNQLGITNSEIEECKLANQYEKIARKLQTVFINDVIENSTGSLIKMSDETSKLLHELRNINNRQIVNYTVLKEDNEIYPKAIRQLMNQFGKIVLEEKIISKLQNGEFSKEERQNLIEKYRGTNFEGFIQYTCNTNQEDFEYTKQIVEEATKQSIIDEQEKAREIIQKKESFIISKDFKHRDERIQSYINYYKDKDISNYTEEQKEQDVQIIMQNIKDVSKRSHLYLGMYKRIALEMGAKYLSTLNDIEFMQLLLDTKTIDENQYKSLTRKYKDIDLHDEIYIQENWKQISKEQAEAIEEK